MAEKKDEGVKKEEEKVEKTPVAQEAKQESKKPPVEAPAPQPAAQTQSTVQAQPKKSNTWLICCGCGCGCAVVVAILIIIFWMLNFFGGAGGASQIFQDWQSSIPTSATPSPR